MQRIGRKNAAYIFSRHFSFQTTHFNTYNSLQSLTEHLLSLLKQRISTKELQQIHAQMLVHSMNKSNFVLAKAIDLEDFSYASLLFCGIAPPNDYAFNVMIRGLSTSWKKYDLALEFYYEMKFLGLKTNNFTYPFVFISCGNLSAIDHGRLAHSMVLKTGLDVDKHVRHSSITMYSKCKELDCARQVFDEMCDRDLVSWNSMISGYSKMGFARETMDLFMRMKKEGLSPDEMTLVSVLGACGDLGDLNLGKSIEGFVVDNKVEMNSYVGSSLIDMYGKCGDILSARRVFDSMKKKDIVTWNAMITGYAQNGFSDESISLFNSMKNTYLNPDKITLIGVLPACASIGALDFGKWIDSYALEHGYKNDIYLSTALIDMYAKCGSLDQASRVFENMPKKNEVSWNAMISGFALAGRAQDALLLFNRMLDEGGPMARPNDITFLSLLSGFVHAGLVNEGRLLFDMMSSSFGLVPKIEHYSCMVDLLARAGLLYEAWDVIEKMPDKPDEIVLGSLLGACQKLGNVEVSERVIKLSMEMEPLNACNYVISSKIYANMKRWDDSARLRVLMREKGVAKIPGCSWIEVCSRVHEFHARHSSHSELEKIYQVLGILYEEMKIRSIDLL